MSTFWSLFIIVLVLIGIIGSFFLLNWTKNMSGGEDKNGRMPHEYDGISEYNKPLPKWWLNLFYITLVFAVFYLILYPGFGNFTGILGWSQTGAWQKEVDVAAKKMEPVFNAMSEKSVEELSHDTQAVEIGQRLFANNCALCHGSDAKGAIGFPNLTDGDWLYGGEGEQIKQSILNGRTGAMPAFGTMFDEKQLQAMRHYLLKLSAREHNAALAQSASETFATICAACHGVNATGNIALGAPNLTDGIWLFGGTHAAIDETLKHGRSGKMPAHAELMGEDKAHVVAAYVYAISHTSSN